MLTEVANVAGWRSFTKLENLEDMYKNIFQEKIFTFHTGAKYILEHTLTTLISPV